MPAHLRATEPLISALPLEEGALGGHSGLTARVPHYFLDLHWDVLLDLLELVGEHPALHLPTGVVIPGRLGEVVLAVAIALRVLVIRLSVLAGLGEASGVHDC